MSFGILFLLSFQVLKEQKTVLLVTQEEVFHALAPGSENLPADRLAHEAEGLCDGFIIQRKVLALPFSIRALESVGVDSVLDFLLRDVVVV